MEIAEYVELKRPRWQALERLLDKAELEGLKALNLDEARALSRLYRSTSSDLLWVRSRAGSADITAFLNDLVARAYAITYPGKRARLSDVTRFLTVGFPEVLRREWRAFAAAVLVLAAGYGFGWIGMVFDPDAALYIVDPQHLHLDPSKRAADEEEEANKVCSTNFDCRSGKCVDGKCEASAQTQAAFSSFLFTHNIGVAFFTFALGITAGVGTALMLFITGILMGSLAWVYASKGLMGWFWAWILPHGIPELTGICIAGAAGFIIARGMIAPRGLSRRAAVRREAVTAVQLLLGTLALFVLAGCIEGTISQIHPPRLSVAFKIGFALIVGTGVYAYLLSGFLRRREPA
jgi:uncharacterized membrane protein SpoIIM required for sporulation